MKRGTPAREIPSFLGDHSGLQREYTVGYIEQLTSLENGSALIVKIQYGEQCGYAPVAATEPQHTEARD